MTPLLLLSLGTLVQPAAAATPDPVLMADEVGMDLLDYRKLDVYDADLGIDMAVGSIALRTGQQTEIVYFATELTCDDTEAGCFLGYPALVRMQHLVAADGSSVTRSVWGRDSTDPATWQWEQGGAITESLDVTAGAVTHDKAWTDLEDHLILLELTDSDVSSLAAVAEDDIVLGRAPFASGAGGQPVLVVPFADYLATESISDWDSPPLPDAGGTDEECYGEIAADLAREFARLQQLWHEYDTLSAAAWVDPSDLASPVGGAMTFLKYLVLNDIRESEARIKEMYAWLEDCLDTVDPSDPPDPDPSVPPPADPSDPDFDQLSFCRICTQVVLAGQEIHTWTEEPDTDTSDPDDTISVLTIDYADETTCYEWYVGFGMDSDYDGFCDQPLGGNPG